MHFFNGGYDVNTIAKVIMEGYEGGIDYETFGIPDEDEEMKDVKRVMEFYGYGDLSIYVFDGKVKEIAGICIVGISKKNPLGFAEIGEICVLPKYRNKQLAECMLKHVRASSAIKSMLRKLNINYSRVIIDFDKETVESHDSVYSIDDLLEAAGALSPESAKELLDEVNKSREEWDR